MKRFSILSLVFGAAVAVPSLALASEEGKAGLPQMDASLFAGQLFWFVLCFALLFVLMKWNIVPRIQRTQDKRQKILADDLSAAAAASDEAKARQAEYEKDLLDARRKGELLVEEIVLKTEKESHLRQMEQQKELEVRISATEEKIEKIRSKALSEAPHAAEDLAKAVVEKLIGLKAKTAGSAS